jgi:hypothetical protein
METRVKQPESGKQEKPVRRDWDRSEWFRRWLELIRQNPAPGQTN